MFQRILRVAAISAALSIAVTAVTAVTPTHAHAQTMTPRQQRSGYKGMFSLGIFGAELGLVIPAAAGLDDWWALVVFPVIGATGGALAGLPVYLRITDEVDGKRVARMGFDLDLQQLPAVEE